MIQGSNACSKPQTAYVQFRQTYLRLSRNQKAKSMNRIGSKENKMKTQILELANTSSYRAPELHELGTLDKVQGYYGWLWDFFYGFMWV